MISTSRRELLWVFVEQVIQEHTGRPTGWCLVQIERACAHLGVAPHVVVVRCERGRVARIGSEVAHANRMAVTRLPSALIGSIEARGQKRRRAVAAISSIAGRWGEEEVRLARGR